MTKDSVGNYFLAGGAASWTAYEWLEHISELCRLLLPIISVLSFATYMVMNWKRNWAKLRAFFNFKK